jgi:hypothetical protein
MFNRAAKSKPSIPQGFCAEGGLDFRELTAIARGASPGSAVFARCSRAAMRVALMPGDPISRIVVAQAPDRRRLTVMLSRDRPTDTASKPSLRATMSIHSRVRLARWPSSCSRPAATRAQPRK